jgi:hypothetical protein
MRVKDARDPFDAATTRQVLVAIAVVGALAVWRSEDAPSRPRERQR